jgi:hypothetical protein
MKQEDCKLKASLGYINLVMKNKKKTPNPPTKDRTPTQTFKATAPW